MDENFTYHRMLASTAGKMEELWYIKVNARNMVLGERVQLSVAFDKFDALVELHRREVIAQLVGMPLGALTQILIQRYNAQLRKEKLYAYSFVSEDDCKNVIEYLDSLIIMRKII